MTESEFEIPNERLPDGFAESIEVIPTEPAHPRPAATVVVARDGTNGLEILLVRRNRSSGFVPGAWVFPGGRVDPADGHPDLYDRVDGLTVEQASDRLGLDPASETPALAYYLASIREAFEETGLLVGRLADGSPPRCAAHDAESDRLRSALLEDEVSFAAVLDALRCRVAGDAVEYVAHWITPLVEPRRYDTRFFMAAVPPESEPVIDPREMIAAEWITPTAALLRQAEGSMPMVFPTIKTLQQLAPFGGVEEAMHAFAARSIPSILPRLVRTPTGVGLEIAEEIG